MKKLLQIIVLLAVVLVSGCMWADKNLGNNNGIFDPDISIAWVDAQGNPYQIAYDENGLIIEGRFIGPKSGLIYTVTNGEGITITDPRTGAVVKVAPQKTE